MALYILVCVIILIILYILKCVLSKNHDYWKKRNVPYLEPTLLFGNYKDTILLKTHQTLVADDICAKFPNEPYIGTFYGTDPALLVLDPTLIKLIFTTHFYFFSGREVNDYAHKEAITKNIFFTGGDSWKIQRQNLTPLFSSSKIKGMFYLIKNCAKQFEVLLEEETRCSQKINAKTLLSKFTIDAITSCAFGINSNLMKGEDSSTNPFRMLGAKIFDPSKLAGIKLNCRLMWPALFYGLKFSLFDEMVHNYFRKILTEVFESRGSEKSSRNDFVDLILTWKKGKVITGESMSNFKTGDTKKITLDVTDDLLTSQCVALYGAGFETTSTVLSFILYEIAKSPKVQLKVIEEVDSYFKKNNSEIEYECVNELPYLAACVQETLRLYPPLGILTREVMDEYVLPTGLRLKKGDRVHVPVYTIHRDPKYYPEPEVFRPERFYGHTKQDTTPYTFFPYGEGSRICIGMRFSRMMVHACLLTVFKKHRLELADATPRTVKYQPYSLVTTSVTPFNLKFISRSQ